MSVSKIWTVYLELSYLWITTQLWCNEIAGDDNYWYMCVEQHLSNNRNGERSLCLIVKRASQCH